MAILVTYSAPIIWKISFGNCVGVVMVGVMGWQYSHDKSTVSASACGLLLRDEKCITLHYFFTQLFINPLEITNLRAWLRGSGV